MVDKQRHQVTGHFTFFFFFLVFVWIRWQSFEGKPEIGIDGVCFFFWLVLRNPVNIFTNGTLGRKILEHTVNQLLVIGDTCQVSYWSSPVWWQACLPDCYIVNSHPFLNCFLLLTWTDCLERHVLFCAWVPSPFSDSVVCLPDSPSFSICLHPAQCTMAASVFLRLFVDSNVQYIQFIFKKKGTFFSNQVILLSRYIISSCVYSMSWMQGERKVDPKGIC